MAFLSRKENFSAWVCILEFITKFSFYWKRTYKCKWSVNAYSLARGSNRWTFLYQQQKPKKSILKNFVKFIRKHLSRSLLFNKVAGLRHRLYHMCFPANFVKFLRTPVFHRTPLGAAFFISLSYFKWNLINKIWKKQKSNISILIYSDFLLRSFFTFL